MAWVSIRTTARPCASIARRPGKATLTPRATWAWPTPRAGVSRKTYVQARMWMNLATVAGHDIARANSQAIAGKMTAADISEAQRLAHQWLGTHGK